MLYTALCVRLSQRELKIPREQTTVARRYYGEIAPRLFQPERIFPISKQAEVKQ